MNDKSLSAKAERATGWGIAAGIVAGIGGFIFSKLRGKNFEQAATTAVNTGMLAGASAAAVNFAKESISDDISPGQSALITAGAAVVGREVMRAVLEQTPEDLDMDHLTRHV